ncbi:MAG TPA: 2,3,4,5-tetrahydropyridine-2,6-dicarboxylate N-succinyltransferase [Planctomycetota bacterium]
MEGLRGEELLAALESGEVRAAEPAVGGGWRVHAWVKEAILALFRERPAVEVGTQRELWPFVDKLGVRAFERGAQVRFVPGGSAVRRGAHVGSGCVLMPPCYLNVGAHVGPGTMIDSHALVGSCAQVGARVHVSAGVQIGGVLEPAGARPVIVEDEAFLGGQCGLYEGVLVHARAVLAAGVVLTASTRVFDLVHERELPAEPDAPLEIPSGAVVVPGTRALAHGYAREQGLALACALIVKYRDAKTDARTALEDALR